MATELEVFQATVAHRQPARILYGASFVDDLQRRVIEHIGTNDIAGHYGFFSPAWIGPRRPEGLPGRDFSKYWKDETLPPGTHINGEGVAMVPSGFFHFWGYISPLRKATSLKEIEDYPLEDYALWDFSHLAADVQQAHAAGRPTISWVGHMYETAWQIRGYEQFLTDLIEQPAWAECLLERLYQQNRLKAHAAARAGVDILMTGDDVASQHGLMFSLPLWRRMILARWQDLWQAAKLLHPPIRTFYHSDGNVIDIVGEMHANGLDILNPVQPECLDVDLVYKRHGKTLCFDGLMGTQSTMPFGTPADVRARVKEIIRKYGRHGGVIITPTHVLEPEVPLANIDAFVEACREYGTFA